MASQPARHERTSSERGQAAPTAAPPRPGMGSRTSSAPVGELPQIDTEQRPSSGPKVGNTLMEEDEETSATGNETPRLSRSRDEVCSITTWEDCSNDFLMTNCSSRLQEPSKANLPEVTIAVVGEDNAGKTSFIKCALDMKTQPSSYSTKKKMSLDGLVYIVRLLEIDTKKVKLDHYHRKVIWPRLGKDAASPNIDGVLLLHDATRADSFLQTTNIVGMCSFHPVAPPLPLAYFQSPPLAYIRWQCD